MLELDVREQSDNKKFEKTRFLTFEFGQHFARLINTKKINVHYVKASNATVRCLGEECPYCKLDKQLMLENPKDYNKQKGWNPRLYRHYFNLLDRTPVKVCPNCGTENKKSINGLYTAACGECGNFISGVEETPSNKVKVANLSDTNATRLKAFQQATLDQNGEPLGLENFDVMFLVTMTADKKKDITPVPMPDRKDKIEITEDQLYDLDKVVIVLSPDEMIELQRGISLKDIFASRNSRDVVITEEEKIIEKRSKEEIDQRIKEMFAD